MMSRPSDSRSEEIARELLGQDAKEEPRDVTLDELSAVYRSLSHQRGADPLLRVVSLQDRLMAQFPEVNSQLLFVTLKPDQRPRDALSFVLRLDWSGPEGPPLRWRRFVSEELRTVWWLLLPLFVGLLVAFIRLRDVELMASLNRLALTSLSIFVSIFVVFVIGESKRLTNRSDLFRLGRLHEFLDVDRMMVNLALLALLLGFLNAALLASSEHLVLVGGALDRSRAWGPIMTALVLVLLFDLFLSIPRYYLQRLRVMFERDAIRDLLVRRDDDGRGIIRSLPHSKGDTDRHD
ncbi:MAG: hypothetical protein ABR529_13925 [Actinomycetota bacterium]